MGCWHSRIEREETVSRCKARKHYMKQFVEARHAFSAAHAMYIRSLANTGSALLHFANVETTLHHYHPHLPPEPPQPSPTSMPPMSPTSDTWASITASPAAPPPPPPVSSSSPWDFWDPFVPPSPQWEAATATATMSEVAVTVPSSLAMVVSRNNKDLVEVVRELHEYFLKAADAGGHVSLLLEVPSSGFCVHSKESKLYGHRWSLSPSLWFWGSSPKLNGFGNLGNKVAVPAPVASVSDSHCSTVERLHEWEKKLCQEVKNAETIKMEHEKKVARLRKLELKKADYVKTDKIRKEVEKLESQMMVASHAIESTSAEIVKLRDTELYPQLIELVKGLMCMWRSMYECHQIQKHIVQQLEYLITIPSSTTNPTSELHRQSTLELEHEVQQWHQSFSNLFKAHRDYIHSLTGWLRLSLFQFSRNPHNKTAEESKIYSLCEAWNLAVDRIPDRAESEGIRTLLSVIHAIVVLQAEEHKQKKRLDAALKELEKRVVQLRSVECKYGGPLESYDDATWTNDPVTDKRAKVECWRAKAEEERRKHEKSVSMTRAMTVNNLQMGFPQVFQGIVGFSSVCREVFESVYNKAKSNTEEEHDVKRKLT